MIAGPYAVRPRTEGKRRRYEPKAKPFQFVYPMGFAGGDGFPAQWVIQADEKAEVTPKPERRRKGDAALIRIAKKWRPSPAKR